MEPGEMRERERKRERKKIQFVGITGITLAVTHKTFEGSLGGQNSSIALSLSLCVCVCASLSLSLSLISPHSLFESGAAS